MPSGSAESSPTPVIIAAVDGEGGGEGGGGGGGSGGLTGLSSSANFAWTLRHYNLSGDPITAAYYDGSVSNVIRGATDRQVHFVVDNYEDLSFSIYLDDPMAAVIQPLTSVVKLWRTIYNDVGDVVYEDGPSTPCFSGFVMGTSKDGAGGQMKVRVNSPLWRLRTRFHVNNHYFRLNPSTSSLYTTSELIWKFIDLLQNAFDTISPDGTARSYMGMQKGNFMWDDDPPATPYFQAKGANGWSNIFDTIMTKAECPELIPRYYHGDGSSIQMYLDTNQARGSDKTGPVQFRYHTGSSDNLDNLTEDIEISPYSNSTDSGGFANYVWAVGQGGPNSGKIALANNIDGAYGYETHKVYQKFGYYGDIKLFDNTITDIAEGDLKRVRKPPVTYGIEVSPAAPDGTPQYGQHYVCGDAVSLHANKGALQVSGAQQRIFECTLRMSENNMETQIPVIGDDVKEHIISS